MHGGLLTKVTRKLPWGWEWRETGQHRDVVIPISRGQFCQHADPHSGVQGITDFPAGNVSGKQH